MPISDYTARPHRQTATEDVSAPDLADQRLSELFAPCFTLVLKLRSTDKLGDAGSLRRRIKEMLDQTEREALRTGEAPETIRKAKFALVAFIDETLLSSDWPQKDKWVNTPLQLELYDQYDAGEVFFDYLEAFLEAPRSNVEVLEMYYLCMALGFKGKYRIHEQEKLRELVESTADTLSQLLEGEDQLSPHGIPRGQVSGELRRAIPTWVVAVAAFLAGVLIYAAMHLYMSASAREVANSIQQMAHG